MKLKHKKLPHNNYDINNYNIFFYSHWGGCLPDGRYKGKSFGLDFYPKKMQNNPSGIKANWGAYL